MAPRCSIAVRTLSSVASTPVEKMETDRRYQPTVDIPDALLHDSPVESEFSIRGKSREGRAAYLDHSATTPLDPRVLDAMAPYMVRKKMRSIMSEDEDILSQV